MTGVSKKLIRVRGPIFRIYRNFGSGPDFRDFPQKRVGVGFPEFSGFPKIFKISCVRPKICTCTPKFSIIPLIKKMTVLSKNAMLKIANWMKHFPEKKEEE